MPVVASAQNQAVKAARRLRRRQHRERTGHFLVEGPQVVAEALADLRHLFVSSGASGAARAVAASFAAAGGRVIEVSDAVMTGLATTTTPQGVVGVAKRHQFDPAAVLERARLAVVLHQASDPGNLGTIIRTADAAGADAVICTDSSVDVTNPKVVRASAGSLFHLPVIGGVELTALAGTCSLLGLPLIATARSAPTRYDQVDLSDRCVLLFGNEAHGLPRAAFEHASRAVSVPLYAGTRPGFHGHAESLNLAVTAAIVLFEAVRQRSAVEEDGFE